MKDKKDYRTIRRVNRSIFRLTSYYLVAVDNKTYNIMAW